MARYDWTQRFRALYEQAVTAYQAGNRQPASCFTKPQTAFLASLGCSPQEVYDFAEDWCVAQEPDFGTVVLVTAARRDFFLAIQKGKRSSHVLRMEELPPKDAVVAGFAWLPRIIAKARAKLRGEMPPELMYGCGGDRSFLRRVDIHPADFLRHVWAAGDDDQAIIDYVKKGAPRR